MGKTGLVIPTTDNLCRNRTIFVPAFKMKRGYSHTHLSIVDEVLEWIPTGENIHHLLSVSDGASAGIHRVDYSRDVNKLNAGIVCKKACANFMCDLYPGERDNGQNL